MRLSDWSSDVCSSDLLPVENRMRINPKYVNLTFATLLSCVMSLIMTCFITALNTGLDANFFMRWAMAWRVARTGAFRSEEGGVGEAWGRNCRYRWWPDH